MQEHPRPALSSSENEGGDCNAGLSNERLVSAPLSEALRVIPSNKPISKEAVSNGLEFKFSTAGKWLYSGESGCVHVKAGE